MRCIIVSACELICYLPLLHLALLLLATVYLFDDTYLIFCLPSLFSLVCITLCYITSRSAASIVVESSCYSILLFQTVGFELEVVVAVDVDVVGTCACCGRAIVIVDKRNPPLGLNSTRIALMN